MAFRESFLVELVQKEEWMREELEFLMVLSLTFEWFFLALSSVFVVWCAIKYVANAYP